MAKNRPEFDEPQTLEECQERMDKLVSEVRDIQTELGNKNKRGSDGKRLSSKDYHEWRGRALKACRFKQEEHQFLKRWKSKYHADKLKEAYEGTDCTAVLLRLTEATRTLLREVGMEGHESETVSLDEAQAFLRAQGVQC